MIYISEINTSIGKLWLEAEDDMLTKISFTPLVGYRKNTPFFKKAAAQILEYTQGRRQVFDLKYKTNGTPFQECVWNILKQIPYGKVWSYSDVAESLGNGSSVRAVGNANHHNPLPILIPCHRVIRKCGDLGGYGGGLEIKQKLLALETLHSL